MLCLDRKLDTFYKISIFRTTHNITKVSKHNSQSIDKHMVRFKHEAICQKQANQMGFKVLVSLCYWNGIPQFDLHGGKTESTEENLGPGVASEMNKSLHTSHCMVFL